MCSSDLTPPNRQNHKGLGHVTDSDAGTGRLGWAHAGVPALVRGRTRRRGRGESGAGGAGVGGEGGKRRERREEDTCTRACKGRARLSRGERRRAEPPRRGHTRAEREPPGDAATTPGPAVGAGPIQARVGDARPPPAQAAVGPRVRALESLR